MSVDRLSVGYEPRFDIDKLIGDRGEQIARTLQDRFAAGSVEVKTDEKALRTGNVYIEHACRGRDGIWRDSGIRTTEADCWAFVIGEVLIASPVGLVRSVHSWALAAQRLAECSTGSNPTKGVVVPLTLLVPALVGRFGIRSAA